MFRSVATDFGTLKVTYIGDPRPAVRAASEVDRAHAQTAKNAQANDRLIERSAKSLADVRTRESRRAADDFLNQLAKERRASESHAASLKGQWAAVGVAATAALALAVSTLQEAFSRAASFDGLKRGLVAVEGSAGAAEAALGRLKETAKLPGLGLREAIQGYTNLRAVKLSADLADRSLRAFGNALATVGKGRTELEGVNLALTQIVSKGKVSAEEINQIAERVPQIREAMKAAFGTADTEILQRRKLAPEEFIKGVVRELEKLPAATGGAANAMENLADAWDQALVALGTPMLEPVAAEMVHISTSLEKNQEAFKAWGQALADIIRGVVYLAESDLAKLAATIAKAITPLDLLAKTGSWWRDKQKQAAANDPTAAMAGSVAFSAGASLDLLRSHLKPETPKVSGLFSPGPEGQKRRKSELDKLKEFAKEWEFVVTSTTGGRHNAGSLHGAGRAMDVSVKGKSPAEVAAFMEAARQEGYKVRDERVRPPGQEVWGGPHVHLEAQSKLKRALVEAEANAVKEAIEKENKAFAEQGAILESLARAIAEADLELKSLTLSTAEQQIAAEYQRLGIGKLTGEAQELGEALFAQRAEQIRAAEAVKEYDKAIADAADRVRGMSKAIQDIPLTANTPFSNVQSAPLGPPLDLSKVKVDPWIDFRERLTEIREEMGSAQDQWREGFLNMAEDGALHFENMFMRIGEGWRSMLGGLALDFAQSLQQMAAQALASQVWGMVLGLAGSALGSFLGPKLPMAGASKMGGSYLQPSAFAGGFADGGYIPPGKWGWTGERGPEPVFGGKTGATVIPNSKAGQTVVNNTTIINYQPRNVPNSVTSRRSSRETFEALLAFAG